MGRKRFDENIHFWPRVVKTTSCWNWIGYKTKGYGMVSVHFKATLVHRWVYEKMKGNIPKNMTVDHICNNSLCVNPDHLQLLTQLDNNLRNPKFGANKRFCKNGHEYTPENTYERPNKKGVRQWRECKRCIYLRAKNYREKNK